ncbi:MAG: hypothetical protein HC908_16425 [Calothrix sp. SM1_7_51]|nr:hypothetical protein [Calothrix sp. SM1_7_51]
MYVNGLLCELDTNCTYKNQPDYPNPEKLEKNSSYLVYLDVWQRHITAIEDPEIREAALDASITDTTTRSQTVWQVKLLKIDSSKFSTNPENNPETNPENNPENSAQADIKKIIHQEWKNFTKNRNNYLNVDFDSKLASASQQIENQLYRVEIHTPTPRNTTEGGTATFKWSRDNAIVVSPIKDINRNTINIVNPGRDDSQFFCTQPMGRNNWRRGRIKRYTW